MNFRKLYKPIQPDTKYVSDQVVYTEFLPHISLQNYMYCYWQLSSQGDLSEPFTYRVVADGCIDVYFELNSTKENYVMGFCNKFTEFPLNNSFHYVGIRFLPGVFPLLFGINASDLSNQYHPLSVVAPHLSYFITDRVNPALQFNEIKALFDQYFIQLISHLSIDFDIRFCRALDVILKNQGHINVEKDLNSGISTRQLRRLFEFYVGDTAKTFSKVIRFQNILQAHPSRQKLRENKFFFDVGYYDQSHFIKEFKSFYGITPGQAFG